MTNLSRIDQRRRNTKNQDGINDAWIAQALPAWITDISPVNARALKAQREFAPFKTHARSAHHQLKEAISEHWSTQNAVDALFDNLTDVYAFAEPLLKKTLSEHYGDIDVRNTYLRLYAAVTALQNHPASRLGAAQSADEKTATHGRLIIAV